MGKIGFVPTLERGEDEKRDVRKNEPNEGLFFKRLITASYAASGERQRLILRSSREIAYSLRHTCPVAVEDVSKWMKALGFEVATIDGEPMWRMYELKDMEI